MKTLHVSSFDIAGGAEVIAQTLHLGCLAHNHSSSLIVGRKKDRSGDAVEVVNDRYRSKYARVFISISQFVSPLQGKRLGASFLKRNIVWLGQPNRLRSVRRGEEDFDFPGTQHILRLTNEMPDIVHCHNLHAGYFDLRYLSELSKHIPVVVTLHDEWLMTGHCAYTLGCEKWKIGCGDCPDLTVYSAIPHDATAFNWARKRDIYSQSKLYVATPSNWLMDTVAQSMLAPAIAASRVIHNGVDLEVFKPGDRREARIKLGIRPDAKVMLFTANGIRNNKFKDFHTLREAIIRVATRIPSADLQFVALGDTAKPEQIGNATITFIPYSSDPRHVATYYQAADVYLHAANSDNFPTTVLESLACGVPVVATAVGGIPEQVEDGVTGYLVPAKDVECMAERICDLLADDTQLEQMKIASAEYAKLHFDKNRMLSNYLNWYGEILSDWQLKKQT